MLKAIELSNACIHLGLAIVEADVADCISKLVRQVMRERSIKLSGLEISLKDKQLAEIIDRGAYLYHIGKQDKLVWRKACYFSEELCLELHMEIYAALKRLVKLIPGYPVELEWAVAENFLNQYGKKPEK